VSSCQVIRNACNVHALREEVQCFGSAAQNPLLVVILRAIVVPFICLFASFLSSMKEQSIGKESFWSLESSLPDVGLASTISIVIIPEIADQRATCLSSFGILCRSTFMDLAM